MVQDYSKEAIKKYLIDNIDRLLEDSTMYSTVVEKISAHYDGDTFVDAKGHDQINEKTGIRKEVKNTNSPLSTGEFRLQSFVHKVNNFDILKIIDSYNNRVFEIPHDVVFSEVNVYGGELRWSASYNKTDNKRRENTNLLLKYEIGKTYER